MILEASTVRFEFEDDLEASHVYRRLTGDTCDRSFTSSAVRTHAWSIFSGLSLADISVLSVIALPLYLVDIKNAEHYTFSGGRVVNSSQEFSQPDGIWTNPPTVLDLAKVNDTVMKQNQDTESGSSCITTGHSNGGVMANSLNAIESGPQLDDMFEQPLATETTKEHDGEQHDEEPVAGLEYEDIICVCKGCGEVCAYPLALHSLRAFRLLAFNADLMTII